MNLLAKIMTIFDKITAGCAFLAGGIIIFLMIWVNTDVFLRNTNKTQSWMVDVASFSLLFVTFLGTTWLLRENGHVSVDFIFDRLRPRVQNLLNVIMSFIGVIICSLLTWFSIQVTVEDIIKHIYIAVPWEPQAAYVVFIIPVGFFLLLIQFIRKTVNDIKIWVKNSRRQTNKAGGTNA
jgi:C4-dicarboxylate transporter, DctQ subunit